MAGGYDTDPVWSPDGKQIAWLSMERNGYEADKVRLMVAELADAEASSDGQSAIPHINGIRDLTADSSTTQAALSGRRTPRASISIP